MTTMDLQSLETLLTAHQGRATEAVNEHLSEKARHDELASQHKQDAIWLERAAKRVRGLREYLKDSPASIAITITAEVEARPEFAPAIVDDAADRNEPAGRHEVGAERASPEPAAVDGAGGPDEPGDADHSVGAPVDEEPALAAVSEAPAKPDAAAAPAAQSEAPGLKDYDIELLAVMRMNRQADGILTLKAGACAQLAGLDAGMAGVAVSRLVRAGRLDPLFRNGAKVYRVADPDGTFLPLEEKAAPEADQIISRAGPPTPRAPSDVETELLALVERAVEKQGTDTVIFAKAFLITKLGRKEWFAVDVALANLADRGRILRRGGSPKDHVTLQLLPIAEAAE